MDFEEYWNQLTADLSTREQRALCKYSAEHAWKAAILVEREACIRICCEEGAAMAWGCAAVIRKRSNVERNRPVGGCLPEGPVDGSVRPQVANKGE